MRENNWEYALDCSAGNGNYYAADRGEAYLAGADLAVAKLSGAGLGGVNCSEPTWAARI